MGGAGAALTSSLSAASLSRRTDSSTPRRVCLSAVLASPYGYNYDMMVVAPAIAFPRPIACCRMWPWDKTALAALWLVPIVMHGIAFATFIPLGVITMIAVYRNVA